MSLIGNYCNTYLTGNANSYMNYGLTGFGAGFPNILCSLLSGVSSYTDCCGSSHQSCNTAGNGKFYAGMYVAQFVTSWLPFIGNVVGARISERIQEKNQSTPDAIANDVKDIQKQIDDKVKNLGAKNVEEALTWKAENEEVGKKLTTLNKNLGTKQAELAALPSVEDCEAAIKAYTDATFQDPAPDTNVLAQLKARKEDAEKDLKKRKELEADIKKLTDTDIPNAQKAIENRQEEIDNTIEEIKSLQIKLTNAKKALNDSVLDVADGEKSQRTSQKRFENDLFQPDSNELAEGVEVKKKDVRFAIQGYRNAKTQEERDSYAEKFKNLYNGLSEEDKNDKTFKDAYKIIVGA